MSTGTGVRRMVGSAPGIGPSAVGALSALDTQGDRDMRIAPARAARQILRTSYVPARTR
jgi:hypothetical protein